MQEIIIKVSQISPLIATLIITILGMAVFTNRKSDTSDRIFLIFSFVLAFWALGCFVQSITQSSSTALIWDKLIYSVAVFAPVLIFQVVDSLIGEDSRKIYVAGYLAGLILLASNWFGYFRLGMNLNFGARFVTTPSYGWYSYLILFSILVTLALANLFMKVGKANTNDRKSLMTIFGLMLMLAIAGNSYFLLIFKKFNPLIDSLLNLNSSLFLIIFVSGMSYLIVKKNLLSIELVVSRVASVSLLTIVSICIFGTTVYSLKSYPIYQLISITIMGLIFVAYGNRIRIFIQTPLEEKFLIWQYESEMVINDISSKFIQVQSKKEAIGAVGHVLRKKMQIKSVRALIADADLKGDESFKLFDVLAKNFEENAGKELIPQKDLPDLNPLIQYFGREQELVQVRNLNRTLTDRLLALGAELGSVIMPIVSLNRLRTLVILGPKLSEDEYSTKDRTLLSAIINHTILVFDRITPFEKLKEDYRKSLAEAEEANNIKSQFIARMSHEFRTPLHVILGVENNLTNAPEISSSPGLLGQVKMIGASGKTLLSLVNDVLDLSKIENGSASLNEESFDIADLLEPLAKTMPVLLAGKSVKFELVYKSGQPIITDKTKLNQIVTNLTGNAAKFTKTGTIKVSAEISQKGQSSRGHLKIEVADTGQGIKPSEIADLFKDFSQGGDPSGEKRGTGLGLAISKAHAESMGGQIGVKSKPAKGSKFTVTVPVQIATLETKQGESREKEYHQPKYMKHKKVLVCDDSQLNLSFTELILKDAVQYTSAQGAPEAIEKASSEKYDLILMDIQMPVIDGASALHKLKAEGKNKTTPVVALTAVAMKGDREKFLGMGFDGYLPKPFQANELMSLISSFLK